ncbi:unnamed protein product [Sphenostylis stenocarpa]|uniref:Uncharacterized protein n=1 Tax=Sphenostylis stenocarpa TaxID=92480 RepID=A0AA86VEJ5_9FABA|nr:unnamed protein product [Sphenostylis stenocarpa]
MRQDWATFQQRYQDEVQEQEDFRYHMIPGNQQRPDEHQQNPRRDLDDYSRNPKSSQLNTRSTLQRHAPDLRSSRISKSHYHPDGGS